MRQTKYKVLFDGEIIAENMSLWNACVLVRALVEEYHNDMSCGSMIGILEMERTETCENKIMDY